MKKNTMMRVASALLVAVLLTTSVISGTFAKYTTSADAEDSARVAKWGVTLEVTGSGTLFSESYEGTEDKITVLTQDTSKLVAPGTANETGVTFAIAGTPEVATKLEASLSNVQDVFLKYDADNNAENGKEATYNPVVFTLTHTYGANSYSIASVATAAGAAVTTAAGEDVIVGTMAQIAAVLDALTAAMTQQNPDYTYDDTFTLTWAWDFDDNGNGTNDKLDTILGNLQAGVAVDGYTAADYCLNVSYEFAITVEQVD